MKPESQFKMRIGDRDFEIILVPDRARDHGTNNSASSSLYYQKIHLSVNDTKWDGIISDLWHEVIEQVNAIYDLRLSHEVITTLGVSVNQVLRDNAQVILEISKKGGDTK